jgi:hypothetical protein
MKTRIGIYEGQQVTPEGGIYNLVYTWKWIGVFWTCLIEVVVVDAHPKLPVGLRDDDRISQPHEVVDLFDEASMQQLAYLFTDEVLPLDGLLLWLLLHQPGVGVDLQMVLNHLPRDPGHLRRLPGEYVDICPEEGDERAFLFLSQVSPDAGGLGGLRSNLDGFHENIIRIRRTDVGRLGWRPSACSA